MTGWISNIWLFRIIRTYLYLVLVGDRMKSANDQADSRCVSLQLIASFIHHASHATCAARYGSAGGSALGAAAVALAAPGEVLPLALEYNWKQNASRQNRIHYAHNIKSVLPWSKSSPALELGVPHCYLFLPRGRHLGQNHNCVSTGLCGGPAHQDLCRWCDCRWTRARTPAALRGSR